ncbi:hypothetical protein [Mycobacteroides abscessus]
MPGGAVKRIPGQDVRKHFEETFDAAIASLVGGGHHPGDAEFLLTVTERPDSEVEIIKSVAKEKGLLSAVFVDDHEPPRPGTVRSSTLEPEVLSYMVEARAQRILNQ